MEGDDRTFRANFTSEGVAMLRERVREKLKEYMGDYTDDTLVEYVIVLLKNGRRKSEAKNELDVFLGDDSDAFISWLWNHLGSSLHLYIQKQEPHADGSQKARPTNGEQPGKSDSSRMESRVEKVTKTSRSRHTREWKGLELETDKVAPLRSSVVMNVNTEDESQHRAGRPKRSLSPSPEVQKKRSRPEERQPNKREVSQASTVASRRLLQFAVRDAVATSRPTNSGTEPSLKRLRSVVSTTMEDSSQEERPQRTRSVRVRNDMSAAIKAVAEAVKDVTKVRSSRNVFDRLGRAPDVPDTSDLSEFRGDVAEDRDLSDVREEVYSPYDQENEFSQPNDGNVSIIQSHTVTTSNSLYDDEAYNHVNMMERGVMDISQSGMSARNKGEEPVLSRSSKDQVQPAAVSNTSANVNTWRPHQYQAAMVALDMDTRKPVPQNESVASKSGGRLLRENDSSAGPVNGNANPDAHPPKESQKTQPSTPGLYSTGPPTEDADSRTIFVSNVHFAATKDSLSRHFNKFGEVLKVIILTDPASGQPKGSAYIEFMRKEAAEHALSLDGTSFMSRILKIVRKSAAQPEAAPVTTWPRIARPSPFAISRFGRIPFPRGMPNVYRSHMPIRPGARSFQWKRDTQATANEMSGQASSNMVPSPATRSNIYVRTEPKPNGSSSTM